MNKPSSGISFIIPMYNSARYIERCLSSFRPDPRVEIVVVDDGSTDSSTEIVENFIKSSNVNINLVKNPHGGTSRTRQTGIEKAHFDYISFVDSDDAVIFDNFMKLFDKVVKYQAAMGVGRDALVLVNGVRVSSRRRGEGIKRLKRHHNLLAENIFMFHGKIFEKSLIKKYYTTDLIMHEDYQTMPIIFAKAERWYNTDLRVYRTFQQPDSVMMTNLGDIKKTVAATDGLYKTAVRFGLYTEYAPEFEAILIMPFIELIASTFLSSKIRNKRKLYQIILSVLALATPNWRANKYYRRLFWGFEWNHRLYNFIFHIVTLGIAPIKKSLTGLIKDYEEIANS